MRQPQRPLAEQAIALGMDLLSKVDPKYLSMAGSFLLKSQGTKG